jgi:hypothetical protein
VWLVGARPWWTFFTGFKRAERTKISLLAAAWRLPSNLFLIPEDPLEPELTPFLSRRGDAWQLDTTRAAEEFYRTEPVSIYGNWLLYASAWPLVGRPIDPLRSKPQDVLAFMIEHDVTLLIGAFHDNWDWCVALREADDTAAQRRAPV